MRIAIPTFGTRVSPRIDCAADFLVVDLVFDSIIDIHEVHAGKHSPDELLTLLESERVEVVVCCGIRRGDRLALEGAGIKVKPGKTGKLKDVLADFIVDSGGGGSHERVVKINE